MKIIKWSPCLNPKGVDFHERLNNTLARYKNIIEEGQSICRDAQNIITKYSRHDKIKEEKGTVTPNSEYLKDQGTVEQETVKTPMDIHLNKQENKLGHVGGQKGPIIIRVKGENKINFQVNVSHSQKPVTATKSIPECINKNPKNVLNDPLDEAIEESSDDYISKKTDSEEYTQLTLKGKIQKLDRIEIYK